MPIATAFGRHVETSGVCKALLGGTRLITPRRVRMAAGAMPLDSSYRFLVRRFVSRATPAREAP